MNDSAMSNSCVFITLAFERASNFDLSATEVQIIFALRALTNASFDEVAKSTGIRPSTTKPRNNEQGELKI